MKNSLSGRAKRLVIRKLTGKERKCIHTAGAVNSWQEMLSDAAFHIREAKRPYEAGSHLRSTGWSRCLPSIASYECWNATERTTPGLRQSCWVSAAKKMFSGIRFRPGLSFPNSLSVM